MAFPQNVLANGERVERHLHPHWVTVLGPIVVGVLLVAGAIFAVVATPDDGTGNTVQWIALAAAVLLACIFVLAPIAQWRSTHYVITSHRVMVRRGVLRKYGKDITLPKITDVSFEQSLLERMTRSGSLRIESAGDSPDENLDNVPHSDQVQQLINHLIDADDTRRRAAAAHTWGDTGPVPQQPVQPPAPERPRLAEE